MHVLLSVSILKPGTVWQDVVYACRMQCHWRPIALLPCLWHLLISSTKCTVVLVAVKSCSVLSLADIHVLVGSDNGSMLGLQACQHPLSAGHQLHQYPSGLSLWSCCGGSLQTPPASGQSHYAADADKKRKEKKVQSSQVKSNLNKTNQIKSNQIKSNQIKSNQIKSNQIKSNQIKPNQIKSNQIKSNQIKSTEQNKTEPKRTEQKRKDYTF